MVECQKDMRIPGEQLPVCPHCGKPMVMNLRSDGRFVQDEGWHRAAENKKAVYINGDVGDVLTGLHQRTGGIKKKPVIPMRIHWLLKILSGYVSSGKSSIMSCI